MSWGPCYMYYRCPVCGKLFRHATDLIPVLGEAFGRCPVCAAAAELVREGPCSAEDAEYEEIDRDD